MAPSPLKSIFNIRSHVFRWVLMDSFHVPSWERRLNERQPPDKVLDSLGMRKGMVVAEVGAGSGRYVIHSAHRVGPSGKVYAVDIDDSTQGHLRDRCRREGLRNVDMVLGTAADPNFRKVRKIWSTSSAHTITWRTPSGSSRESGPA